MTDAATDRDRKQKTAATPARPRPRFRSWYVVVLGVVAFYAAIFLGVFGTALLRARGAGDLAVAVTVYALGMPVFILTPGRYSRGYNPFGRVVRRAAPRLLHLHLLCLLVFTGIIALHLSTSPYTAFLDTFTAHHPDLSGTVLIFLPVALVITQGVRSGDTLTETRKHIEAGTGLASTGDAAADTEPPAARSGPAHPER